jgi:hypothetical protein
MAPPPPESRIDSRPRYNSAMAHIDECVPGRSARVQQSGVPRVNGRVGVIVEVSRVKRTPADALVDTVTVDVPKHGPVVVAPADLEIVA